MSQSLRSRFLECISGPWQTGGDDIQYCIVRDGDSARVFFQGTDIASVRDLLNDADFVAKPYKDQPIPWKVHGGFLRGFKSVIDKIAPQLEGVKRIYCAGFSAGAAYATLFHEWAWFNIAPDVESFVFGSPRVLWMPAKEISSRFENLTRVYVRGDLVTMVPPWWMGYKHAGKAVRVGPFAGIDARKHPASVYLEMLPD